MGAAQSSAAASLRAHEPLLARLAGPEAIGEGARRADGAKPGAGAPGGDDALFWTALLTTLGAASPGASPAAAAPASPAPAAVALAALPPAEVEAFLAPHVRRLVANNPRTRNWQRLVSCFGPLVADRAAEAMAKLSAAPAAARPSADEAARRAAYARDAMAAANAMHVVAVVIKIVARMPAEKGGGSAGLARMFAAAAPDDDRAGAVADASSPAPPSSLAPAFASQVAALLANSPACPLDPAASSPSPSSSRPPTRQQAAARAAAARAWADACYCPVLEATRLALALAATQLHGAAPSSPPGANPLLEALFEGLGQGRPGAGALAAQLLRLAVARPQPPPALRPHAPAHPGAALVLAGGRAAPAAPGSRSAVARVFWGARCAAQAAASSPGGDKQPQLQQPQQAQQADEAGAAGCGGPVGDGAMLLLLLLLHFPAHHAGLGENCVRQALYDLADEDEDEAHPPAQGEAAAAGSGRGGGGGGSPGNVGSPGNGHGHVGSPGGSNGKKFALRISFSALLAHFSQPVETEAGTLLLYSLLHGNRAFRERALASPPAERAALLLPLLRALYAATEAPPAAAAAALAAAAAARSSSSSSPRPPLPPFLASSPNHLYMLQIVLLILSQDQAFAAAVHAPDAPLGGLLPAAAVSWFAERRLAAGGGGGGGSSRRRHSFSEEGVTLGSLVFVVLLRSAAHSFGAAALAADLYLPTNTLAALANLAPHARGLHPHAAQRLVGLAASLGKRYLRARRALERRRQLAGDRGGTSAGGGGEGQGDAAAAAGPLSAPAVVAGPSSSPPSALTEEQVNVLGDFLRIVLEIINAVLAQPPAGAPAAAAAPAGAGAAPAPLPPASLVSGVEGNPELVYAVMHRRDALVELRECPRVAELADNVLRVAEFFSARLAQDIARGGGNGGGGSNGAAASAAADAAADDAQSVHEQPLPPDWGVERVLDSIVRHAPEWSPAERLRAFPDLRFVYEEEEHPEEFFVPYAWAVALAGTSAAGLARWDLSSAALLLHQEEQARAHAESHAHPEGHAAALQQAAAPPAAAAGGVPPDADDAALAAMAAADAAAAASAAAASAGGASLLPRGAPAATLAPLISGALSSDFSLPTLAASFPSLPTLREEEAEPAAARARAPPPSVAGGGGGGFFSRWSLW